MMLRSHRLALAALAAACSPAPDRSADAPLARAVSALRSAVVGDRRFGGATAPGPAASTPHRRRDTTTRVSALPPSPPVDSGPPFDTSEVPTVVIPFTSTHAAPLTLWVGDGVALPAPQPPAGTPSGIVRNLRWTSSEPGVATVAADGAVTTHAPGTTDVIAWRRVGEVVTPLTVLPAVRGRVATADDAPVRARVVVRTNGWADTLWTGADGTFALRPPATRVMTAPVTVRVEPADATHTPALFTDAPGPRLADLDVVLLPTRWRVGAGSYAGEAVAITPAIAQGRVRDGLRFWRVARSARTAGGADAGHAVGWAPTRLPLAVAFESGSRGGAIGPTDSAAFWRIARQLERDWGAPLFRPAARAAADAPDFIGLVVGVDGRQHTAGLTTVSWDGQGDVGDAMVTVQTRSLLGDPRVVTHELLHALGIGHASPGWSSVMHPSADAASGDHASLEDVAYGQLLYAIRAHTRPGATPVGIAEAAAALP